MTRPRTKRVHGALILVDFINHFKFEGASSLAPRAVKAARNAAKLKAHIKSKGGTCIYANDNFGVWDSEFSSLVRHCIAQDGASREIAEILRPARGDLSVIKPRHSAFYGTPLEFLLDHLEVTTLTIAGIALDMCVLATVYDAHIRKFTVRVPANCVAGFSKAQEISALTMIKRLGCEVAGYRI